MLVLQKIQVFSGITSRHSVITEKNLYIFLLGNVIFYFSLKRCWGTFVLEQHGLTFKFTANLRTDNHHPQLNNFEPTNYRQYVSETKSAVIWQRLPLAYMLVGCPSYTHAAWRWYQYLAMTKSKHVYLRLKPCTKRRSGKNSTEICHNKRRLLQSIQLKCFQSITLVYARYCRSCEMVLSPTDYFALHNAEILSPVFYFAIDPKEVLTYFRFALESTEAVTQFRDLFSVLRSTLQKFSVLLTILRWKLQKFQVLIPVLR